MELYLRVAREQGVTCGQVESVDKLLQEGNTIPFIARYRKEVTGELDEVKLRALEERLAYLKQLGERKAELVRLIGEQGKLTPEIEALLAGAQTLQQAEDVYLPFRPKRRTRATMAKEKGLQPLADYLLAHPSHTETQVLGEAAKFCTLENGITEATMALAMAKDIIAEQMSESYQVREAMRHFLRGEGSIKTSAKNHEDATYAMYFDFAEPLRRLPPHRILAINRGESEEALAVELVYDEAKALRLARQQFVGSDLGEQAVVGLAISDGCKRLLWPSLEREVRAELTESAEAQAISVFGQNLKQLLLQSPVKGKTLLAIDPAYRTGCKLAVLDPTGRVLETGVAYFTLPHNDKLAAKKALLKLISEHAVSAVAIGNGTGSRESEEFIAHLLQENNLSLPYTIVSEAGASVYSASPLAVEELPELDVTLRGAVSIGRRVLDPLAELVKIDPKAIGVGQYQHDVNQKALASKLEGIVTDCVNSVGVDLNTSSPALLRHVAGITPTIAKNVVAYRDAHGVFKSRAQLKKVARLGPAAFLQCAGFLRIAQAENVLDSTPVHPESYELAERFLQHVQATTEDIAQGRVKLSGEKLAKAAQELGAGLPTLRDIYAALEKPGRDPREDVAGPVFRSDVLQMEDLEPGMVLSGVVRNVIDFGAFVDIGVKQDGLIHISELSDSFVKHPSHVLAVGQVVEVRVLGIDAKRQRISLSRKGLQ